MVVSRKGTRSWWIHLVPFLSSCEMAHTVPVNADWVATQCQKRLGVEMLTASVYVWKSSSICFPNYFFESHRWPRSSGKAGWLKVSCRRVFNTLFGLSWNKRGLPVQSSTFYTISVLSYLVMAGGRWWFVSNFLLCSTLRYGLNSALSAAQFHLPEAGVSYHCTEMGWKGSFLTISDPKKLTMWKLMPEKESDSRLR